jgi:hypothetical protein
MSQTLDPILTSTSLLLPPLPFFFPLPFFLFVWLAMTSEGGLCVPLSLCFKPLTSLSISLKFSSRVVIRASIILLIRFDSSSLPLCRVCPKARARAAISSCVLNDAGSPAMPPNGVGRLSPRSDARSSAFSDGSRSRPRWLSAMKLAILGGCRLDRDGGRMGRARVTGPLGMGARFGVRWPSSLPGVVVPLRVAVRGGLPGDRDRERDDSLLVFLAGLKSTVLVDKLRLCPGLNLLCRWGDTAEG